MRKLIAPAFFLALTVVLARFTTRVAPYLVGTETLAEQVNGTLSAGMFYLVGLETVNTVSNIATWLCIGWLVSRIFNLFKEKNHHE